MDLTNLRTQLKEHLNEVSGNGIRSFQVDGKRFDYEDPHKLLDLLDRLRLREERSAPGASTISVAQVADF